MDFPKRMSGLSLFSGIGGIDLALDQWVRTDAYCEIDPYCQSVMLQRMQEGYLSKAPIWPDIRTLPFWELPKIDIIFGGFPCQDISVAGAGKGLAGERSGLFYEIVRICCHIKPRWIFLENVPAITSRGGIDVVREITKMGYDCRWCVISASSIGALHRRERWFLLAHAKHNGTLTSEEGRSIGESFASRGQQQSQEGERQTERTSCLPTNVANPCCKGLEGQGDRNIGTESKKSMSSGGCDDSHPNCQSSEQTNQETHSIQSSREAWREHTGQYWPFDSREHWQEVVSEMGKCSDGIPHLVERLRSLGNSVVPQQVKQAFEYLIFG